MIPLNQSTCHIRNYKVEEALITSINEGDHQKYAPPYGLPELQELILDRFEVTGSDAEVLVTDGSTSAIYQAVRYLCHPDVYRPFVDMEPSWGWTKKFTRKRDFQTVPHKIRPEDVPERGLVNICSPQNPTGEKYKITELISIAQECKRKNAWLLYDCAYRDYGDYVPLYKYHPDRTITTFSFSKSVGCMRLGGVICNPDVMRDIYSMRPNQLGSSLVAQKGGIAALKTVDQWLPDLLDTTNHNRDWIYGFIPGKYPRPDNGNSVWLELERDSSDVTAEYYSRGILVRDGKYYGKGHGNFIKITTSVPHEWVKKLLTKHDPHGNIRHNQEIERTR